MNPEETVEDRLSRLAVELRRSEKFSGEHAIIRRAIAKIHRRKAKGKPQK